MKNNYSSRFTPFYASEDLKFAFSLMKGAEVQDLSEVDIILEVYTSQLSPRRFAASFYLQPDRVTTEGVVIKRAVDGFKVSLRPAFLKTLPSGVLTFVIRYNTFWGKISNKIVTERFVNDMPVVEQFPVSSDEVELCKSCRTSPILLSDKLPWIVR